MPDISNLLLFVSASVILIFAPGPDILFVVTQGVANGRRAGFLTAVGLALGNSVHTLAVAFGLSIVFKTSVFAFNALKTAGVLYLLYLAVQAVRHRHAPLVTGTGENKSALALVGRGFFMNVLNPKVALFFLAFLPQFITGSNGNEVYQIIFLGVLFIGLVMIIFGMLGLTAGTFGQWLLKNRKANVVLAWFSAVVFTALGIKLAMIRA